MPSNGNGNALVSKIVVALVLATCIGVGAYVSSAIEKAYANATKICVLEERTANMRQALERIESKLDRLLRRDGR